MVMWTQAAATYTSLQRICCCLWHWQLHASAMPNTAKVCGAAALPLLQPHSEVHGGPGSSSMQAEDAKPASQATPACRPARQRQGVHSNLAPTEHLFPSADEVSCHGYSAAGNVFGTLLVIYTRASGPHSASTDAKVLPPRS